MNQISIHEWTDDLIDEAHWHCVPHDDWSDANVIGGWLFGRELTTEEIHRLSPEQEARAIANYLGDKA